MTHKNKETEEKLILSSVNDIITRETEETKEKDFTPPPQNNDQGDRGDFLGLLGDLLIHRGENPFLLGLLVVNTIIKCEFVSDTVDLS